MGQSPKAGNTLPAKLQELTQVDSHLAAPVAENNRGPDLGWSPTGALIMGNEPDVIPAACPVPVWQLPF